MAMRAGRGTLAAATAVMLLGIGVLLAALVDPFTRLPVTVSAETEWYARGLLVLSAAWLVIGMVAARTRLVRRPGAAAARATWVASTRPWRARESALGVLPLDRWLMIVVPGGLLVATRFVQAPHDGALSVLVALAGWLVFALAVRLLLGRRSPWPVIAAVGGALVLRCTVALGAVSLSGPEGVWQALWTRPTVRVLYISIAFALLAWLFVAAGWSLTAQIGARRATGIALAGVGAGYALPAATVAAVGAAVALDSWNDQIGVLPWNLGEMTGGRGGGLAVELVAVSAAVGAVVAIIGIALALPGRQKTRESL
ncbi:hypothetical protein ACO03V_13670 [Microbacterium sp. HMH0099]|uniref:hypothetical protein n=1 Tax=Microbacterium sp. HMH0099 TaxID=3414026 RepID=UPI003BF6D685